MPHHLSPCTPPCFASATEQPNDHDVQLDMHDVVWHASSPRCAPQASGSCWRSADHVQAKCCDVHVCAPRFEQSAKSQALSLGTAVLVEESAIHEGVQSCFAVHGTPADAVQMAVTLPLAQVRSLVVPLQSTKHHLLSICTPLVTVCRVQTAADIALVFRGG